MNDARLWFTLAGFVFVIGCILSMCLLIIGELLS
jgi:hypothetical protein